MINLCKSYKHITQTISTILLITLTLISTGCKDKKNVPPDKIKLIESKVQASPLSDLDSNDPKKINHKTITFIVNGKKAKTILGGETKTYSTNAKIKIEISQQPQNAGATLTLLTHNKASKPNQQTTTVTTKTDGGGRAQVQLNLGKIPGVYKIKATMVNYENVKPTTAIILGGLIIKNDKQDGFVNHELDKPLWVLVEKSPGIYSQNSTVKFSLDGVSPKNTQLKNTTLTTSSKQADGTNEFYCAETTIKLGKKQGKGVIHITLKEDSPLGAEARDYAIKAKFFAIDRTYLFITIIGALALFIYGMKMMSDNLSLAAGDKMRSLLNTLTKNRVTACTAGLVVTGLIQSSSACSVMVIGFVNAGLMQLEQAIGVIMGANIGTTVTAQMISFKLNHMALPAIAVGMIILMIAKKNQTKFMAQVLIGFGILFLGLTMLSAPLKTLKDATMMKDLFKIVDCDSIKFNALNVTKAIGVGTLVTMVIQSSSAAIGLLLALVSVGLVGPYTGFAILLGTNIGTTVTAVLAAIGANTASKRTACAHFLFNVIGTIIMIILFFIPWHGHPVFLQFVSMLVQGDPFKGENLMRYLANCHTIFNVGCTLLFLGFVPVFAKLCRIIIPGGKEEKEAHISLLEPHLLASPSIAIQQTWAELRYMVEHAFIALGHGFEAIPKAKEIDIDTIKNNVDKEERNIDRLQEAITAYVSQISSGQLNENQGRAIPGLLHSVNDAEKIGDYSVNLVKQARRLNRREEPLSETAITNLTTMFNTANNLFKVCDTILNNVSKGDQADTLALKNNMDQAFNYYKQIKNDEKEFRKSHIKRQEQGNCDVRSGLVFLDIIDILSRTASHIINICQAATTNEI